MHVVPHRLMGPMKVHEYELQRGERKGWHCATPKGGRGGGKEGCVCGCVDNFSLAEGVATPKPSITRKHLNTPFRVLSEAGWPRSLDLPLVLCLRFRLRRVSRSISVLGRPETEISDS
jgi:hypothetical protein